jgi:hypothetical protein
LLLAVTVAPGIDAPVASEIVPAICAVVCASTTGEQPANNTNACPINQIRMCKEQVPQEENVVGSIWVLVGN